MNGGRVVPKSAARKVAVQRESEAPLLLEREKVHRDDVEFAHEQTSCLNGFAPNFDLASITRIALILSDVSDFCCFDAVCLQGFALYREVFVFVGDDEIAFSAPVMVVCLVDIIVTWPGKVHFPQFVFCDITEHQTAHARVLLDDLGKLPFRQVPSL